MEKEGGIMKRLNQMLLKRYLILFSVFFFLCLCLVCDRASARTSLQEVLNQLNSQQDQIEDVVNGVDPIYMQVTAVSGSHDLLLSEQGLILATGNAVLNLPDPFDATGGQYTIRNEALGIVTTILSGGNPVAEVTDDNKVLVVMSDGTIWFEKQSAETDPTVPADLKDGVDWSEVSNRPAGLDDGDDVGITTESDPDFAASAANGISLADIGNWNAAHGWGDHAQAGYLTGYSETDPVFAGSPAHGVTLTDLSNWNAAYGWGDHAQAGYDTTDDSWTGAGDVSVTTGSVGIGIATPAEKLDIVGGIRLSGSSVGNAEGTLIYDNTANALKYCDKDGGCENDTDWVTVNSGTVSYTGTLWNQNGNTLSYTTGGVEVGGNIVPTVGDQFSLGSPDKPWKHLYLSANSLVFTTKTIPELTTTLSNDNGVLTWGGEQISNLWSTNGAHLYSSGSGNVGIGISGPGAKLDVNGQIKIRGGSPGAGKLLASDASGLASWQTIGGPGSGLDADLLDGKDSSVFAAASHSHDSDYASASHDHDTDYLSLTGKAGDAELLDGKDSTEFMAAGTDNWVDVSGDTMTGDLTVNGNIDSSGVYKIGGDTVMKKDSENLFLGVNAGENTTGHGNIFTGNYSGRANTTGDGNTFTGYYSGWANTKGNYNTFTGYYSGRANDRGYYNTFTGALSGYENTSTSHGNTFTGFYSGYENRGGSDNTFTGAFSGCKNTGGRYNTFTGRNSGRANTTGNHNTFIGHNSGYTNTTGEHNTFVGYEAGRNQIGSDNVFLGYKAGYSETGSNKLYISNSDTENPLIYGEFDSEYLAINGDMAVFGSVTFSGGGSISDEGTLLYDNTANVFKYCDKDGGCVNDTDWVTVNSGSVSYQGTLWTQNGNGLSYTTGNVGIGTGSPGATLDVGGNIKISGGNPGDGKVLTSDANGLASWKILGEPGTGWNADLLDGKDSTEFADTFHDHDTEYLPLTGMAEDADLLDGKDSTEFAAASHAHDSDYLALAAKAADADLLDGKDSTEFATASHAHDSDYLALAGKAADSDLLDGKDSTEFMAAGTDNWVDVSGDTMTGDLTVNGDIDAVGVYKIGGATVIKASTSLFLGIEAGESNTGVSNTFSGYRAGYGNTTGYENTFSGHQAGYLNIEGNQNSFFGNRAGYNTTGSGNTFLGYLSGYTNTTGEHNTVIGYEAGRNQDGSGNVFMGYQAGYSETGSNKLYIANSSTENPLIYGEFDNNTVAINGDLKVDTQVGIGTENLTAKLSIKNVGGNDGTKLLTFSEDEADEFYFESGFAGATETGNTLRLKTYWDNYPMTWRGDGNVGIGTTSPSADLHISDPGTPALYISSSSDQGHAKLRLSEVTDSKYYGFEFDYDGENDVLDLWSKEFNDNDAIRMTWHKNGNIVFGNREPEYVGNLTMLPHQDSPVSGRLSFGTDGSGWQFRIAKNNGGTISDLVTIKDDGSVGIGETDPSHPLHMGGGAYCSGTAWVNASSRAYKENIKDLTTEDALAALRELKPTRFKYRANDADEYLGFIAEDVPEIVATPDRKGLVSMDIVAVLTKVVQQQQKEIDALKALLNERQ